MKNKTQDRIEKLKGLKADKESQAISDRMIDEARNGRAFPEDIARPLTEPYSSEKLNLNHEDLMVKGLWDKAIEAHKDMLEKAKQVDHIIKLNEELTAENSRLLEKVDSLMSSLEINNRNRKALQKNFLEREEQHKWALVETKKIKALESKLFAETEAKLDERNLRIDFDAQLSEIKSKWWYKLMTWGW